MPFFRPKTKITEDAVGDTVIGSGRSPQTGRSIEGRQGKVQDVRNHFGDMVVDVTWDGGDEDTVYESQVTGTTGDLGKSQQRRR